jgi:hypothetical protein
MSAQSKESTSKWKRIITKRDIVALFQEIIDNFAKD